VSDHDQGGVPTVLPGYAAGANPRQVVFLLCKGECCSMRWAEVHQSLPSTTELRHAQAYDYDATCLDCGRVAHDPYNWIVPSKPPALPSGSATGSSKRVEANRRNAKRSTGPRTRAGKARSSQNAMRHGLLAKRTLLAGESEEELALLRRGMRHSLKPVGEFEEELVEKMVSAVWRKRRADGVEQGLWDARGTVSAGKATIVDVFFLDSRHDHSLEKLTRYAVASNNEFARCFKMLKEAQGLRRDGEEDDWLDPERADLEDDGHVEEARDGVSEVGSDDDGADEDDPDDGGGDDDGGGSGGAGSLGAPAGADPLGQAPPAGPAGEGEQSGAPGAKVRGDRSGSGMEPLPDDLAAKERRWTDLTDAEKAVFLVRTQDRIEEFDDMLNSALLNPMLLARLPFRDLLKAHERFNDTIWQTMEGIDRLLQEGAQPQAAEPARA
jgi:hypothetical protein